jgi:hypothetical protein
MGWFGEPSVLRNGLVRDRGPWPASGDRTGPRRCSLPLSLILSLPLPLSPSLSLSLSLILRNARGGASRR